MATAGIRKRRYEEEFFEPPGPSNYYAVPTTSAVVSPTNGARNGGSDVILVHSQSPPAPRPLHDLSYYAQSDSLLHSPYRSLHQNTQAAPPPRNQQHLSSQREQMNHAYQQILPPPSPSYAYPAPATSLYSHIPVAQAPPQNVSKYPQQNDPYPSDVLSMLRYPQYAPQYLPQYPPQLNIPSHLSLSQTGYSSAPSSGNGYALPSSPAESSRSYATTAESHSRQNSPSLRFPPYSHPQQHPAAALLPVPQYQYRPLPPPPRQYHQRLPSVEPTLPSIIDLTHSPPNSTLENPSKRRKTDAYYDPSTVQQQQQQVPIYPQPYQRLQAPLPKPVIESPAYQIDSPKAAEPSCADKDGHFIVTINGDLTSRYKILKLLGQGTFGRVVEAFDRVTTNRVAIKIIRAVQKYRDASKVEIRVLNTLRTNDPYNSKQCIHLLETFDFRNHICMVFELLSQSVFDFLKDTGFVPFPILHTRDFGWQILEAVAFLHSLELIHTDLKPENLMLENNATKIVPGPRRNSKPRRELVTTRLRLIDFGSAIFEDDYHSSVVSTRHYRAPEIILSTGWSYPCDMWSVGCILVEFCTGDALFQTHDNLEHLALMEAVLGPFPAHLAHKLGFAKIALKNSTNKSGAKYFKNGRLNWPSAETTKQSIKYVAKQKLLRDIINPKTDLQEALLDLIQKMLVYDPAERISAVDALKHRFFRLAAS
ncbi:kinase-like domain-containing protein [Fimicolochytrium jonesii]|uniref:kinase-like domain-containing protein n=1 Tax=Fimicolochytrium jonesii TaxID=1396493 RepID=UPI0022FE777A|nr:kinase-like domain-containing protein [Fimicolochytrium jonesii]KAI8819736.1 kinase-like domain-containing protein [Fimicolochytrium jonesii]